MDFLKDMGTFSNQSCLVAIPNGLQIDGNYAFLK